MQTRRLNPARPTNSIPRAFFCSLCNSRLLSAEQLARVEEILPECDQRTLSSLLVEMAWLTPYQAKRIEGGDTRNLVVGQYRILEELGGGGFGRVFKGVHALMNRQAAIKFISPELGEGEDTRAFFLREVVATTRLSHPNIAVPYECNETDGTLWFAMEYIEGPTLQQFVETNGPLPVPSACAIVSHVAQALHYAHQQGMIHRDIKPANLMLLTDPAGSKSNPERCALPNVVKVVDFGLARIDPTTSYHPFTICTEGATLGTPDYIAPEQARDGHRVDARSDLYSLGCTFYFALTGQLPFPGSTAVETMAMRMIKDERPVTSLRADIPAQVATIVHRLMSKRPEDRYQTAGDLVEALACAARPSRAVRIAPRLQASVPVPEASETPPPPTATERERRPAETPALPSPEKVRQAWGAWAAALEQVVFQRLPDERVYVDAYRALMALLRTRPAGDDPWCRQRDRMESLVEPWINLRSLRGLDRRSLEELYAACTGLDAEVFPSPASASWLRAGGLALLFSAVAGGVWFAVARFAPSLLALH